MDVFMVCLLELDALGDELLLDNDSSYLDEASSAPAIPEGTPGERSTNRVMTNSRVNYMAKFLLFHLDIYKVTLPRYPVESI